MSNRAELLQNFRECIAGILNVAVEEIPDDAKIALANVLQASPDLLRLHVRLEPFYIVGAVMSPDRSTPPVELFRIEGDLPTGASH